MRASLPVSADLFLKEFVILFSEQVLFPQLTIYRMATSEKQEIGQAKWLEVEERN